MCINRSGSLGPHVEMCGGFGSDCRKKKEETSASKAVD